MKVIKIYAMQKDEDDILEDWILYHSYLVGIENIYIIDNCSDQASKTILDHYQFQGLNVSSRDNYGKKGEHLHELIAKTSSQCDIAIPIDLDEFIGLVDVKNAPQDKLVLLANKCLQFDEKHYFKRYPDIKVFCKKNSINGLSHFLKYGYGENREPCSSEKFSQNINWENCQDFLRKNQVLVQKYYPQMTISCDREQILEQFNNLPPYGRYAFSYYLTSRNTEMDYDRPLEEVLYFDQVDMSTPERKGGNTNKKFFTSKLLEALDHGNHFGRVNGLNQSQCYETNFILFHYHHRGIRKLVQKCKNDMIGLGYVKDIDDQRELKERIKQEVPGAHNIVTYLKYLVNGPYSLYMDDETGIRITKLAERIRSLRMNPHLCLLSTPKITITI